MQYVTFALLFLAAHGADAFAADSPVCPDRQKLKNMCMIVGNHMKDNVKHGKYEFLFQRRFFDAACIAASDSKEARRAKPAEAWKIGQGNYLACTGADFDILRGNILKYVIANRFDEFIKGNELESMYVMYYLRLRKAGAKHAREL